MKQLKALSALAFAFVLLVLLSSAASAQTAITVSGQVTNGRGELLAGVRLILNGPTFAMATADANGAFSFSVPAGNYTLNIHSPDSYDGSVHAPPVYTLDTSTFYLFQNMTLNLQLPFKKLLVHIQDSQGTPVANAVMGADSAQASNLVVGSSPYDTLVAYGQSYYATLHQVVTNASGDADLWLLPTPTDTSYCSEYGMCTYVLTAQPPSGSGLALASLSDMTLTQDSSVTITLPAGVLLTGSWSDAQGNPLSGLLVTIRGYSPFTGANLVTDANGRYTVSVAPGTYGLKVDNNWDLSKPYDSWNLHLTSDVFEITQNMTLNLAPFKRVNVHVVDGNNQPVAGVAFDASEPFGNGDPITIGSLSFYGYSTYSHNNSTGETHKTDANGNATLSLLPASNPTWGGYTITAYPPDETGLPTKSLSNILVAGDTSLTIRLSSWVLLSGRITDADGNGLPNQSVDLAGTVSTDSNGYYAIPRDPGFYFLNINGGVPVGSELHAPQSYNVSTRDGMNLTADTTLDLTLPFKRVNVHAVDANDQPVVGALLGAQVVQADDLTFGGMVFYSSSSYSYDTSIGQGVKTDANGNATLWLLPASGTEWGGYGITASAPLETGLSDVNLSPVFVTGDTNITLRFDGVLPAKVPVLASLSPASVEATSPSFTLVVTGTDYIKTSVVRWNGADRSTTYVSNTQLTTVISSADIASPGTTNVTVWTPPPGGGLSNSVPFTITLPSATINVYAAMHTTGTGATSGDQKSPLALSLKVFDRATFPSAELKDYATVWNSGPGLVEPLARITGPTVTTFSNGPANLYTVQVPATSSANNMTSGRYLVVGKVEGAEAYVGAATDPLAVDSVTDEYFQITQKSDGASVSAVSTPGSGSPLTAPTPTPTAKGTPKATQTPKPKPTPAVVSASPTPKPTATPKKTPPATRTAAPTKTSPAKPKAPPTQTPVPAASATPKKAPTIAPLATGTLPPTKTPHPTMTPRDTPKKH